MKLGVFSVFDAKAEIFSQPVLSVTKGTMMRTLMDIMNDPNHPYAKHPEDYVLYFVGEFDDQRCAFSLLAAPESMAVLRDLRVREE